MAMHANEAQSSQFRVLVCSCAGTSAATIRAVKNRIHSAQPLLLVVKIALFLLLLGFAALNSDSVTLRYFLGLAWQAPLSLVILAAFAVGLLTGLLGCSLRLLRNQRELRALHRQIDAHQINPP
jgi:uncharacterized integral membrane protein